MATRKRSNKRKTHRRGTRKHYRGTRKHRGGRGYTTGASATLAQMAPAPLSW